MSTKRTAYVEARDALLERITVTLKSDERFIAAWLAGSFARGEQNWCSDLDLHVVVAEEYSETLCAQPWPMGARTTGERLALFQQFGEPAVVYDAHANNLVGGTFTYVLYKASGVNVDWMLIPQAIAHLEYPSLMLFQKRELPAPPLEQPPSPEQCAEHASLYVGFFWMIAASSVKNLLQDDPVQFHLMMRWLEDSIREVRAALRGEQAPFTKASRIQLLVTQEEQIAALRSVCDEMETLIPQVIESGGYVSSSPRSAVELRLALLA